MFETESGKHKPSNGSPGWSTNLEQSFLDKLTTLTHIFQLQRCQKLIFLTERKRKKNIYRPKKERKKTTHKTEHNPSSNVTSLSCQ